MGCLGVMSRQLTCRERERERWSKEKNKTMWTIIIILNDNTEVKEKKEKLRIHVGIAVTFILFPWPIWGDTHRKTWRRTCFIVDETMKLKQRLFGQYQHPLCSHNTSHSLPRKKSLTPMKKKWKKRYPHALSMSWRGLFREQIKLSPINNSSHP